MSAAVTVAAPAKINLRLGVGPVRPDGYHPLGTVYLALDLLDTVTAAPADDWSVTVRTAVPDRVDTAEVPTDARNLAAQAARLLAVEHGTAQAVHPVALTLDKAIPVAGGLAGGSADAAAALVACDRLWGLGSSDIDLLALAARLGSDVPFALLGGAALGEGHGQLVTPLPVAGPLWWAVLPDPTGLSTPAVYRTFDELAGAGATTPAGTAVPDGLAAALAAGDVAALAPYLVNDLEVPAVHLRPALAERLAAGHAAGAVAPLLSGSGPTCLYLCTSRAHADEVVAGLAAAGHPGGLVASGPTPGALR
ncbi:MAG: 4-(cytidine 5'-diphospho)-2-C-methyl-D-erythritol kinase [Nocardioides sp.]|nr:4-(cytidine 5'-diphospho)-2-C-methyl-D-erythritol kinase [Nocardioides sp.]